MAGLRAAMYLNLLVILAAGCSFGSGYAQPPFSAQLIRASSGEGRSWHFRTTELGKPPTERALRFAEVGPDGAVFESVALKDGQPVGEAKSQRVTWDELEAHAHYGEHATVVDDVVVAVPAGRFRCLRYTVKGPGGVKVVAAFATTLPGPPVLQEVWRGEVETSRTELVAFTVP
jgi:hypothetical protein